MNVQWLHFISPRDDSDLASFPGSPLKKKDGELVVLQATNAVWRPGNEAIF